MKIYNTRAAIRHQCRKKSAIANHNPSGLSYGDTAYLERELKEQWDTELNETRFSGNDNR